MTVANSTPQPAAPRSSLDRVYAALDAAGRRPKRSGLHIQARCPLHEDSKPSLSINWVADRGGMTRGYCHSCNADEQEILDAIGLGLADRFDQPLPPREPGRKLAPPRGTVAPQGNRLGPLPKRLTVDPEPLAPTFVEPEKLTSSYDYVDEDGHLLYQVRRWEWTTPGGRDKRFTQRQPTGDGQWEAKVTGRRVLWHLPAVASAIAEGRAVWLCEGEKDVDSLNRGPLPRGEGIATTNAGGAGGFTEELAEQLRGAHVRVVIDRDPAGYVRAHEVSRLLHGVAASCTVVLPAVDKDATDHLAAGHGIDEFTELSAEQVAVLVAQAHIERAVKRAETALERADICLREARARWEAAGQAQQRGAAKGAEDERRYALRWGHEAVKVAAQVADLAEEVWKEQQTQHARVPIELRSQELLGRVEQAQRTAQRLAEQTWDVTGQPRPAPTQQTLTAPVPSERHAPAPAPTTLPAPTPLPVPAPGPDRPDGEPAQVVQFPTERTGGGNSGGPRRVAAIRTTYQRVDGRAGGLFEVKTRGDGPGTLHEVLSLDVRIRRIEVVENDGDAVDADGIRTVSPQSVLSYVISYTHPDTGEVILTRIQGDRVGQCDWLGDLGVMVDYDSSSKGRARVWDAIRSTSRDAETVTIFEATGWRELPDLGWTYIHAGGGITADGPHRLPVRLPGAIDRIDLPAPIDDAAELRRMFEQDSLALMIRLPRHVGAVLAGTAYRAVLGMTKPTTCLFGTPGTYKSALASLMMHHFGQRWERSGASTSMSGRGATVNALPELWHRAKDAVFFGDDFAPDKGVEQASQFLSTVARMQYNQESRSRMNMRSRGGRGGVDQGYSTRTTLLLTSEVRAFTESGEGRLNTVDLARGDVDLADVMALDAPESRRGRATMMASLLQWMAKRLPDHQDQASSRARLAAERRTAEGSGDRVAEPLAELEAGWELIGDWLVDIGAYTPAERAQMMTEVRQALDEAGQRSGDPDSPSNVGERVRRLLDTCLRSGAAHVTVPGGSQPAEPDAIRLGYRRVPLNTQLGDYRLEPRGEHIGVITHSIHGSRLHLEPDTTMAVILSAARRAGEAMAVTKTVVQRELAAIGILRTEKDGSATRYTVPVPDPSGAGGQVRRWDLDADRIFWEPEPPAPTPGPAGPVGPHPYPADQESVVDLDDELAAAADQDEDDMALVYEQTDHRLIEGLQPCTHCGEPTSLVVDGRLLHYMCWKRTTAATDTAATDTAAADTPATDTPATDTPATDTPATDTPATDTPATGTTATDTPATGTTATGTTATGTTPAVAIESTELVQARSTTRSVARRRPAPNSSPWKRSVAVFDATGIYLPDGRSDHPVRQLESLDDVATAGVELAVGHPAAPGLLVLTESAMTQLGLMPGQELLTDPGPDGEAATEDLVRVRILDHLTARSQQLLGRGGWTIAGDRVGPWALLRREDRAFRLVLEPLVWMWDPRSNSPSPFLNLPEESEDGACWTELARRLDRLATLLGVPWSTSAGVTGAAVFDQVQRRRDRRGGRVLDRAGVLPELDATGQHQLEPELDWPARAADKGRPVRTFTKAEVGAAAAIQFYDRRGSYLAPSGGADLPVGDAERLDAEETAQLLRQIAASGGRLPVGLWLVSLPAWDEAMPPPHPDQHRFERVTRWVTTPTLQLLLDDNDAGGAAYTVEDLQPAGVWVWQEHGRLLEPWYRQVREALLAARTEEGADGPVSAAIKGVYTGYIGRMGSDFTATGARPWHHQPVWRSIIIGSSRSGLWRVLRRHQLATGRIPASVHIDEVAYLDDSTDPTVHPPAVDTGALGKFKPSGTRLLNAKVRAALVRGGARVTDDALWADNSGGRTR